MDGRVGSDCNIEKATSKDSKSVIDYGIVSLEILCDDTEFNIVYFDCLFSDIHCAIKTQISLCINYSENDENTPIKNYSDGVECLASHPKKVQWDKNKSNEFVQSLDLSDVDSTLQSLQEGENNVNNFCLTLSNAFTKAAHCTFKQLVWCVQKLIMKTIIERCQFLRIGLTLIVGRNDGYIKERKIGINSQKVIKI